MSFRLQNRRLFAPEVVQTSTVDCGPAALSSLLKGFGIPASFDRLREACQTKLDGTSIDTMEKIAGEFGLQAEQVILPLDHVLLSTSDVVPAILITDAPDGTMHFVVAWRRIGRWVQVMDPRCGRRWITMSALAAQFHVHTMTVPADTWRSWAGGRTNIDALRQRAAALGIGSRHVQSLLQQGLDDPTWRTLAILDAALRMVANLADGEGVTRGREALRLVRTLVRRALEDTLDSVIPNPFRCAQPLPGDENTLLVTGVVALTARGRQEPTAVTDTVSQENKHILTAPAPRPLRKLLETVLADGRIRPLLLSAFLAVAAGLVIVEALLMRGILTLGDSLTLYTQRMAAMGLLFFFFAALMALELPSQAELLRFGRALELRLRIAFLSKARTIGLSYFQSRPTSDTAERCHRLHALRGMPHGVINAIRAVSVLSVTVFGLLWLAPSTAPLVLPLLGLAVVVPLAVQPLLFERDLRFRTQAGSLTRFYLDALLGISPIRSHSAARAVQVEHESLLVEWWRTGIQLLRANIWVRGLQALVSIALALTLIVYYLQQTGEKNNLLLLAFWAISLPQLAQGVVQSLARFPSYRSFGLRLLDPLGAPDDDVSSSAVAEPATVTTGAAIKMRGVHARAGGRLILDDINLDIRPGSHVAIVGASGSGKSSLVGVLLGWRQLSEGSIEIDGQPMDVGRLRNQTAWLDPTVQLWNKTLYDNVVYGARGASTDCVGEALAGGDLRTFIEQLPDGMQTALGENGGLASGGEGQRVRFARTLMRPDARLVILDEAFRGTDRNARRQMLERARMTWPGATLLCVTHDIEDTLSFPTVVVVEDGRIVEHGTPAQLSATSNSRYRAMLDDEQELKAKLWNNSVWKRWQLDRGAVGIETRPAPLRAITSEVGWQQ